MSHEEKVEQNRFRLSKEITLGDLATFSTCLTTGLFVCFKLWFTLEDHEKRIASTEAKQVETDKVAAVHTTQIAVLQSYAGRPDETRLVK